MISYTILCNILLIPGYELRSVGQQAVLVQNVAEIEAKQPFLKLKVA